MDERSAPRTEAAAGDTTADMTAEDMTIDEVARAVGAPTSTVRLYQNRGLLAPPVKRGRVGYYDRNHLARLRLIGQLQERGFSLAAIKELVDGLEAGDSLRAVLGLRDAPSTWSPEVPRRLSPAALADHFPESDLTPEVLRRVVELGLVEAVDGGDVVIRAPSFLGIGRRLVALGLPVEVVLDQYEALSEDATRIAGRFTDVFRAHMWEPFVEAGMPADRIGEMVGALEQLGPLAEGVVVMTLRLALQDFAETFIRAEAERLGIDIPSPGGPPPDA